MSEFLGKAIDETEGHGCPGGLERDAGYRRARYQVTTPFRQDFKTLAEKLKKRLESIDNQEGHAFLTEGRGCRLAFPHMSKLMRRDEGKIVANDPLYPAR